MSTTALAVAFGVAVRFAGRLRCILAGTALASASLAGEPQAQPPIMYVCLYQEASAIVGAGMDQNPHWAMDHIDDEDAIGTEIWGRCAREHPDEARGVDRKAADILADLALTDGIGRMTGKRARPRCCPSWTYGSHFGFIPTALSGTRSTTRSRRTSPPRQCSRPRPLPARSKLSGSPKPMPTMAST